MRLKDKIRQWLSIDELNEDFVNQTIIIEKQISEMEIKISDLKAEVKMLRNRDAQNQKTLQYLNKKINPKPRKYKTFDEG